MNLLARFMIAVALARFGVARLCAQPTLRIVDLMTAADYQKCGLQKLIDSEKPLWMPG
jgi:hypothetical protein